MIRKITQTFQALNHLIQKFLSRLYVFQQILSAILIMALFLVFVSYNGFGIVDRMQKISSDIFNEGIGEYNALYGIRLALTQYKSDYLLNLHRKSVVPVAADFIGRVSYYLSTLKNVDPGAVGSLEKNLAELKIVANEPVSEENLIKVTRILSAMDNELMSFDNKVQNNAVDTIRAGEKISERLKTEIVIIIIISIFIAVFLSLFIAGSVSRPFKAIVSAAKSLAKGDLTRDVNTGGSREAAEVVQSLNFALGSLRDLVRGIHHQSEILSNTTKELKNASADSGRSASEVAKAMDELAKASTNQTEQISEIVIVIDELSELVRKVFQDTTGIASSSEKVAASAKTGQSLTNEITLKMDEIYASTQKVAKVTEDLQRTSEEINEISSVISGIAEQTSLLALNASIEAARAGEYGRGFSVVADETGKLAEQSKQSALLISELIGKINLQTGQTVETIQKEIERVETGKDITHKAAVTFGEMFTEIRDVLNQIKQVAISAEQMSQKNEFVINAINTIAAFSQETMANTEEVSAAAVQQSASSQQVASLAENMEQVANTLQDSVALFEIKADA